MNLNVCITLAFLLLRGYFAALLVGTWEPLAMVIVFGEALALAFGVHNLVHAKSRDNSLRGLILPSCYVVGMMFVPVGDAADALTWLQTAILAVTVWVRLVLGTCYSVGGTTFVGVVSDGPYAVVRHPLLALALASRVVALIAWPSMWNFCIFVSCGALLVAAILVEEAYLKSVSPEYVRYSSRVRPRLCPRVW